MQQQDLESLLEPQVVEEVFFEAPAVPAVRIDVTSVKAFHDNKIPEFQKLSIKDAASQAVVAAAAGDVKKHIETVTELFKADAEIRSEAHKLVTGERKKYLDPATALASKLSDALVAFKKAVEAAEIQRRKDEAKRLEEETKRKADEAAKAAAVPKPIWEEEDDEVPAPPPLDLLPEVAPIAIGTGVALNVETKKGNWKAEVVSLKQLILTVADKIKAGDESLVWLLAAVPASCNAEARKYQDKLGDVIPGLIGKRDEKAKV